MWNTQLHICLYVDNFSGHNIAYEPKNIQLKFFEPNLTLFVQPLNASIIQCFKANYQQQFCTHTIDLDDAGELDVYKINILEEMLLARAAWKDVSSMTIKNCWDHTQIQPSASKSTSTKTVHTDPAGWTTIREFAASDMTLPDTKKQLEEKLSDWYVNNNWCLALNAVLDAEGDTVKTLEAIQKVASSSCLPHLTIKLPAWPKTAPTPQLKLARTDLMDTIKELHRRRLIRGDLPTVDKLIDSADEDKPEDILHSKSGSDDKIVAMVQHEIVIKNGEAVDEEDEEDDNNDDEEHKEDNMGITDIIQHCQQIEWLHL